MYTKSLLFWLAIVVALTGLAGCKKQPEKHLAPMGETAPAFGSDASTNTLQSFVVGDWGLDVQGADPNTVYTFVEGGTFTMSMKKQKRELTGRYTVNQDTIMLTYDTLNGKPIQQAMDEARKDSEGGGQVAILNELTLDWLNGDLQKMTQLRVDDDKKSLTFDAPATQMEGELNLRMPVGTLTRYKAELK